MVKCSRCILIGFSITVNCLNMKQCEISIPSRLQSDWFGKGLKLQCDVVCSRSVMNSGIYFGFPIFIPFGLHNRSFRRGISCILSVSCFDVVECHYIDATQMF
jgi:hypothetical protein